MSTETNEVSETNTIEIENIGPLSHLSIPVPEGGGVVVLKARNGRGKSRGLQAVDAAITGRGKLDVKDGRTSGTVKAFGVTLKVSRSTRRTGELEVESLEGRLSVADLVDPGIKSPDAADAKRIKALTQLSGVDADIKLFHSLLGGQAKFETIVHRLATDTDDLVTLADRIKRDIEAKARETDSAAELLKSKADGCLAAAEGIEIGELPETIDPLQEELEAAIEHRNVLAATEQQHKTQLAQYRTCYERLEKAKAGWSGGSPGDLALQARELSSRRNANELSIQEAKKQLADMEHRQQSLDEACEAISNAIEAATEHFQLIGELEEEVISLQAIPAPPEPDEIAQAAERVTASREALQQYEVKKRAQRSLTDGKLLQGQHLDALRLVKRLREAAKGTDGILSEVVAKSGSELRVESGRLVCQTVRGSTYFSDLSAGERWKIAIDIAVSAVGSKGVLTIPQEAWEGLDGINREIIAEHARKRGVLILTAECGLNDEVISEVFS